MSFLALRALSPVDPLSRAVGLLGQPRSQLLALAPSSRSPSLPSGIFSARPFRWHLVLCPTMCPLSHPDFFLLKGVW